MYIELYKYVEGDENCESGEYLGYVSLEEDDVYIDLDDERLGETLEELFSEPLSYSRSPMEPEKDIEPYTDEFFRVVLTVLPDYGIRGKLEEDEIEDFEKPLQHDVDDAEIEEEEEMPVGITVDDIDRMQEMEEDDHYRIEDDEEDAVLAMMDEDGDY